MIYLYECNHCGEMDIEQKITDERLSVCPKCSSKEFRRLIAGAGGFTLQGPGWARDGYTSPLNTRYGRNM